jgi:DNA-directed RNA polymerase subunit RPC12/RpoP
MIATNGSKPPRPNDACQCPGCSGRLRVYKTRINFVRAERTRYLHCPECGHLPEANKWILPLEYAPSRSYRDAKEPG